MREATTKAHERAMLDKAHRLYRITAIWTDLLFMIFAPRTGIFFQEFPTAEGRRAFRKTQAYEEIWELVEKKMLENGEGQ